MFRRTLAAASILALAGCATEVNEPAAPAPTTEAAEQSGPIELALGETANLIIGANGPRDIDVTVNNITVSEQCHHGLNSWHDDYTHDGGYFIQVTGEIDVRNSPEDFTIPGWAAADADRNIIEVAPASECAHSDEPGVQTFGDLVIPGHKSQAEQEYWVDTLPSGWFLNEPYEDHAFVWPVPDDVAPPTALAATTAPAAAPAPAPAQRQAPAPAAPTFVNCYLADGTALMSDGTHQYMDSCNESAGGPYLLEDGTSIYDGYPAEWFE